VEKFEKFTKGLSRGFEWVGVIGILAMFAANLVDVVGAKVFKWPLPGAIEILSFSLVVAIAPAIAYGLFLGTHLRIDFIVDKFPKTLRFILGPFVSIMCMILFILISWKGFEYAHSLQISGEKGGSSHIPFFPFAYILSFSCIPVILFFVLETIKSLKAKR
jgi:TRAP-type C4-dicarboxylate transport system permease small subunit